MRVMILPPDATPEQETRRAAKLRFTHVLMRGGEHPGLICTSPHAGAKGAHPVQSDTSRPDAIAPDMDALHENSHVSAALRAYGACDPRYRRHEMISLLAPLYGVLPTPGARFMAIARGVPTAQTAPAALEGLKPWPPAGTHPRRLPADAGWLRDATWRALAAYCAMTPGGYAVEMCDVRGAARESFVTALNALLEEAKPYRGAVRMWVHTSDVDNPVMIFMVRSGARVHMLAANFGTAFLAEYVTGIPRCEGMRLLLSTDGREFGGCGYDLSRARPSSAPSHGFQMSVTLALPPLATLIYRLN